MDKGEYENELKQVIGDTRAAFVSGILLCLVPLVLVAGQTRGTTSRYYVLSLRFDADVFVVNFFNRFISVHDIKDVRKSYTHLDPRALANVEEKLLRFRGYYRT